jgi:ectoine hydroxylase-related dioxygenase (phytanoyl-CoA dioxygenase family)
MDAIRRGEYDTGQPPAGGTWKPGDDEAKLCKIEQPQMASRAVFDLVSHPAIGEIAAAITGASMVQVWWVQLLHKPSIGIEAGAAPVIGWHQDRSYWGNWEEGSELFTAWVALTDVEADCGPMQFLRGSHRWGLDSAGDFYAADLEKQKEAIRVPEGERWDEVSALMAAGGMSFHHHLTFHGSGPNLSGRPRRSFAVHLRTQNSRPVGDKRQALTAYIDDPQVCPVIYGRL